MKCFTNSLIIVILVTLLDSIKYASSILCYDCNSAYDPRCGEEFDSFSLGIVNCSLRDPLEHIPPMEATLCRSIKMEIYGKVRVVRQCGYITGEERKGQPCRRHTGIGEVFVTHCACDTDLCNTAFSHNYQKMALLLVAVLLLPVL